MAENCMFRIDKIDTVTSVVTVVSNFIEDRLVNKEKRTREIENHTRRLEFEDDNSEKKDTENRCYDQAVLSNLEWGSVALEEAISTSNMEAKIALLDYAEKMLNVCAKLKHRQKIAGVPNSYLLAWAHLNLSYLSILRNDVHNAVVHILEMFIVDPFFSRMDFAPQLWKTLFLPHLISTVKSFSERKVGTLMDLIQDSCNLSSSEDQAEKVQEIEHIYGGLLDENTRIYAKYYRDCLRDDSAAAKKTMPMLPTAEPSMNPLQKVTQKVHDTGRFRPILPNGAAVFPSLKPQANTSQESRFPFCQQNTVEESEEDSENEGLRFRCNNRKLSGTLSSFRSTINKDVKSTCVLNQSQNPTIHAPIDYPKVLSNKDLPLKEHTRFRKSSTLLKTVLVQATDSSASSGMSGNSSSFSRPGISPLDTENEAMEQQKFVRKGVNNVQSFKHMLDKSLSSLSDEGNQSSISLPLSNESTPLSRMPKDFICPITSQVFSDPVTLETGQTYERKAIQQWIYRGNTTCPITRQPLSAIELPKTNLVLIRLITTWEKEHPDYAKESPYDVTPRSYISTPSSQGISPQSTPSPSYWSLDKDNEHKARIFLKDSVSTSPTSLLYQPGSEILIKALRPCISCLCNSEDLKECESAVLKIGAKLTDSQDKAGIHSYLSSPTILNGFIKILTDSLNPEVLRITIRILSLIIYIDGSGIEILSVDFNLSRLATLLKDGLAEVAVLIYVLQLSFSQLAAHDLIPSLTRIVSSKNEETNDMHFPMESKEAALALLEQIIIEGDENARSLIANNVISAKAVPDLLKCLDKVNTRQSIVEILLCCIHKNKSFRNLIAHRIELSPVLVLFHAGTYDARATCIKFLSELVRLSRRTSCNRILQRIKDEGAFSTMHTLLIHLQMAPVDQKPSIASFLLQLDLLVEPRDISVYREEAIETLLEALQTKSFPTSQMAALNGLSSLPGHFDSQGRSCLEGWLLKIAGFDPTSNLLVKKEKQKTCGYDLTQIPTEEEKVSSSWMKKAAFVLCNHKNGMIFRVLEECLKDNSVETTRPCIVMATWLIHVLYDSHDIGITDIASKSLLRRFIDVLHSSKSVKDKILATLALRGFLSYSGIDIELGPYAKQIYKTLKKLKLNSLVVDDLLKALINLPSIDATELWSYDEGPVLDATMNGEVLAMVHIRGRLVSSHSDGTIKTWDTQKKVVRLIQEAHEHTKAVTSLCLSSSGEKLFSGSLDKTIRVWVIKNDELYCTEVHNLKEPIVNMSANSNAACFLTQGTGVKVYYWTGVPKQVTLNKQVKCINLVGDKLYCGCTNYSIQEVDIATLKSNIFYTGTRKWLGKQTINSLKSENGVIVAGGSCIDGIAGKVLSLNDGVEESLSTGHDIEKLTMNKYYIYAATKVGVIVWLKERMLRIGYIIITPAINTTKLTCLATDAQGQMLFTSFSNGKIQVFFTK